MPTVFAGSKKCTRDGFACCHPERSEGSPRWSASRGFFVTLRMTAQGAIANYSLLIILDSHIATLLGMTARSAKNWAVVLLSRRPSHNGHKQLLTFYTIKSLSLYLPSGRAHIALRLLRWVKIRLLLTF